MTVKKSTKRLRPKRGLGAGYTRTRRIAADRVRKMAEERREQAKAEAKAAMERAARRQERAAEMADQHYRHSVVRGVAKAAASYLRSKGREDITVDYGLVLGASKVDAWTDFERIVVRWPAERISTNVLKHREVLAEVAQMRGVFRHEVGHIEFTTPWDVIAGDTEFDMDHYGARSTLAHMNNVLEDQRMEGLVVDASPKAADDFKRMVLGVVMDGVTAGSMAEANAWTLLAGRTYLSDRLRSASMKAFDDANGKGMAQQWLDIVGEYIAADTNEKLGLTTEKAYRFLTDHNIPMPGTLDGHTRQSSYSNKTEPTWADRTASFARTPGSSGFRPNWTPIFGGSFGGAGGQEGGQSNEGNGLSFADELQREHDEAMKNNTSDREAADIARNANAASHHVGMPEYSGPTQPMTLDQEEVANQVAVGMQQALTSYVTATSPTWLMRQEQGVIDPLAYRTAGAGLRDYRRHLEVAEDQDRPFDVHVTVLADSSGSMGGNMVALSQVLYGTKVACDNLGIGNSMALWSTEPQNYRVWAVEQAEPVIFPSMGGTDPTVALDDLENHNEEGAGHHLVVIFTDGAWGTFPTLQNWQTGDGNRTIVLVRYGFHDGEFQGDMGADNHIQINNVLDLAGELTDALASVLADASGAGGWD